MIDLEQLKGILELVREHEVTELELEADGMKVRIRKGEILAVQAPARPAADPPPGPTAAPVPPAPVPAAPADLDVDTELAVVKSPIVGTFYRAPEPNAPPFVEVGDHVRKGQTLCIIEAMKMMNNIDSEHEGTIVRIYVENGLPVQFGERLFAIRAN